MINIPLNTNSVYVSIVQTGCLKAEFDSTYPIHLNGIISPDEFRESINKINRKIISNKILISLAIVFTLSMIGGIILFIVGGLTSVNSRTYGFSPLLIVGICVTIFGSMFFSIGCCIVQFRRAARIRQVIAEESMKYSSRSPIPCSWRLDTGNVVGGYGHHNGQIGYHLVIDIGHSTAPVNVAYYSNEVLPESTLSFEQPPPYFGQSAGFCSKCGTSRQNFTTESCSSCGQSFNKY